mmetsp:Transcript_59090/g.144983  ORF Transcript_59090/g.144983 Transcript_59090/m.144983 type:complete len:147 (+) Transcript_59090:71-511(+)|eukprot:CAMPEP_0206221632 /NCGR_PEP_ID=MMETSP0047_2-20121206/5523_1 /ASSEMBLY_ACC=CAM_ASM_000192 /TAXON_ID=195065 /ORGANISM="Chroomonas mesostigmatica_cf, Strain CCMP1168" /LENGTH=146 /DNA_ID=CAMNT_0053644389 /DNA_START=56 /DNA_END=496 /DNA_ORIENTATION=-
MHRAVTQDSFADGSSQEGKGQERGMKRVSSRQEFSEQFLLSMLTEEAGSGSPLSSLKRCSLLDIVEGKEGSASRTASSSGSLSPLRDHQLRAMAARVPSAAQNNRDQLNVWRDQMDSSDQQEEEEEELEVEFCDVNGLVGNLMDGL